MKNKLFKKDNWSFKDYALLGFLLIVCCGDVAKAMDLDEASKGRETVKLSPEEEKQTFGATKEANPIKEDTAPNTKPRDIWRKKKEFMEKQELDFKDMLLKKENETQKIEEVSLYELTSKTTALIK